MRKLISIGLVIALLVTFVVPVATLAQSPCAPSSPQGACPSCGNATCPNGPKTMGGALLWTLLATTYIMGRAVGDVTETIAGTLGCWVDKLAPPAFGIIADLADGVGGLLKGLGTLLGMSDIFDPLGTMLSALAADLKALLPA